MAGINLKGVMDAVLPTRKDDADDSPQTEDKPAVSFNKNRRWPRTHKAILRRSGTKHLYASLYERSVSDV